MGSQNERNIPRLLLRHLSRSHGDGPLGSGLAPVPLHHQIFENYASDGRYMIVETGVNSTEMDSASQARGEGATVCGPVMYEGERPSIGSKKRPGDTPETNQFAGVRTHLCWGPKAKTDLL